ncbi:hypothetical protein E3P99_03041 [Wallemia hederae]|uniref:Arrestin-like N-terminal domain-containing protein n=1 Tax=Wallemia hederae TaxID=1540922 RepID=A0A4T0FH55_9BASI|nr:hypothetical protein E3P99_03041 [Wallemia hederae]
MPATLTLNLPRSHNVFTFSPIEPTKEIVGIATLTLPTARKIKSIDVDLKGVEEVHLSRGKEKHELISERFNICGERTMQAGEHHLDFFFFVPNTFVYERHSHGTSFQYIKATVVFDEWMAFTLTQKLDLLFAAHPKGWGYIPFGESVQTAVDGLGPVEVTYNTRHLTVSAVLEMELHLARAASDLRVHGLQLSVEQLTTLFSRSDAQYKEVLPAVSHVILNKGSKTMSTDILPERLSQDYPIKARYLTRLPDDTKIRGSHCDYTDSAIQSTHRLVLDIWHSTYAKPVVYKARIALPVKIPHCLLSFDSVLLPRYEDHVKMQQLRENDRRTYAGIGKERQESCNCTKSYEEAKAVAMSIHDIVSPIGKSSSGRGDREGFYVAPNDTELSKRDDPPKYLYNPADERGEE